METPPAAPFPIVLRVQGERCVVLGSGHEAELKSAALERAGATVVRLEQYDPALIEGAFLVVSAGPGRSENPRIFADCVARGILVNCLDDPQHCRFTFPSIHRQGDLTIAVSTNGACPALAVRIREAIGRVYGPEYGAFLSLCRTMRERVRRAISSFEGRRGFWYLLVESPVLKMLREGRGKEAQELAETLITQAEDAANPSAGGSPPAP